MESSTATKTFLFDLNVLPPSDLNDVGPSLDVDEDPTSVFVDVPEDSNPSKFSFAPKRKRNELESGDLPQNTDVSSCRLLVSGISGTIGEFCKNIVLAGVGSVTLMDDRSFTFFVAPDKNMWQLKSIAEVNCDWLRELNPRVHVSVQEGDLLTFDGEFYDQFTAVVVGPCSLENKKRINEICRKRPNRIAFYSVDCRDLYGEIFVDLQNYSYAQKKLEETVKYRLEYSSFEEAVAVPWKSLPTETTKLYFAMRVIQQFEQDEGRIPGETFSTDLPNVLKLKKRLCEEQCVSESHVPDSVLDRLLARNDQNHLVCEVIGGILGQEVIRMISGEGYPVKNFLYHDVMEKRQIIEDVTPESS